MTQQTPPADTLIGRSIPPAATTRFVQGRGNYVDDHVMPRMAHMMVLRSPHASADILSINTEAARASPGVIAVLTGADLAADGIGRMRSFVPRRRPDGSPHFEPPYPLLAQGSARHVGFPIAVVVAETLPQAHDAAELIEVDYQTRPAVTETRDPAGLGRAAGQYMLRP